MLVVALACVLLVALTTLIHYESLRLLNFRLQGLRIPSRTKLLVAVLGSFVAHALETGVYGLTLYLLLMHFSVGSLTAPGGISLANCLYFSAETYTSLGFGDITPTGPVRMLAGAEALNGLLLIGWSASFIYLAMERFWNDSPADVSDAPDRGS